MSPSPKWSLQSELLYIISSSHQICSPIIKLFLLSTVYFATTLRNQPTTFFYYAPTLVQSSGFSPRSLFLHSSRPLTPLATMTSLISDLQRMIYHWSQQTGVGAAIDNMCRKLHRLHRVLWSWEHRYHQ